MPSYFNKTLNYLKRNGVKNTYYAVMERLSPGGMADYSKYTYQAPDEDILKAQRESWQERKNPLTISLVVPAYETKQAYLTALMDSVLAQTWESWELILADASTSDVVEQTVALYEDARIHYVRLENNDGISANTNAAIGYVADNMPYSDYVGLLDHDDLLTPDALYEMAAAIENAPEAVLFYSDEDKCDGTGTQFYEPHIKEKFNLDLFLTNNYICHLTVLRKDWLQELKFRPEMDGAQDFDLVLRVLSKLLSENQKPEQQIIHISKILYHWRCHSESTADNPGSKLYAYEAGRRAIADFLQGNGIHATVKNTSHLGFYRVDYEGNLWKERKDIGIVGGKIIKNGKVVSGNLDGEGNALYAGLDAHYSGYLHRAALVQDAEACDVRSMEIREELRTVFEGYFSCQVPENAIRRKEDGTAVSFITDSFYRDIPFHADLEQLTPADAQQAVARISVKFCERVRQEGCRIVWDPEKELKL